MSLYHSLLLSTLQQYTSLVKNHNRKLQYPNNTFNKVIRILGNDHGCTQSFHCEPSYTKHLSLKVNQVYYFKLSWIANKNKFHWSWHTAHTIRIMFTAKLQIFCWGRNFVANFGHITLPEDGLVNLRNKLIFWNATVMSWA